MTQQIKLRDYYYYTDSDSYYYKQEDGYLSDDKFIFKESMNDKLKNTWQYTPRTVIHINGDKIYRAEFKLKRPADCFSWESWKHNSGGSDVKFYCNDVELFTEYSSREPIFYTKDGITRVTIITNKLHVYDMNGDCVANKSDISIGMDCFVDFIQVSPRYAIGMTEECCTYDPCGSIWDLETLMFDEETEQEKFYSNHRTPITLAGKCGCNNMRRYPKADGKNNVYHYYHSRYIPILATPDGFVVWDTVIRNIMDTKVSYKDAYTGNFEFDPDYVDPLITVSQMCGRSVEELEDEMFRNNGTLSFQFSHNDGPN
jgi:hypothetical protein